MADKNNLEDLDPGIAAEVEGSASTTSRLAAETSVEELPGQDTAPDTLGAPSEEQTEDDVLEVLADTGD